METKKIKNLVFDFGGILVGLDKHRCIAALDSIGAYEISVYVDECRQEDLFHELLTGIPLHKLKMLENLKQHYRLFLLSNTNVIHWERSVNEFFRDHEWGINDFFERLFLSYEMGMVKPDTEIFSTMLDDAGLKAEETLFIDDSAANCAAAAALGINVLHDKEGEKWVKMLSDERH